MTSLEPLRGKAYHEDLKWRMVYQLEMLGLSYQQIASNLNVHTSTSGELSRGLRKKAALMRERMKAPVSLQNQKSLPLWNHMFICEEIVRHIQDQTGTIVHESTNNFSLKRLSIARQRNAQQKAEFQAECELY